MVAPSAEAMRIWMDVIVTGAEGYTQFMNWLNGPRGPSGRPRTQAQLPAAPLAPGDSHALGLRPHTSAPRGPGGRSMTGVLYTMFPQTVYSIEVWQPLECLQPDQILCHCPQGIKKCGTWKMVGRLTNTSLGCCFPLHLLFPSVLGQRAIHECCNRRGIKIVFVDRVEWMVID